MSWHYRFPTIEVTIKVQFRLAGTFVLGRFLLNTGVLYSKCREKNGTFIVVLFIEGVLV